MARPKEFDPTDALDKAMAVFWAKGYHDTSIRDLVDATGVNYYGLYSTFDDKHGLFLAALDRYRDTVTRQILAILDQPGSPISAIRQAFDGVVLTTRPTDGHRGCLMCNTAVELTPFDKAVAKKVRKNMDVLRDAFRGAVVRAREIGEVAKDKDIDAFAEFLAMTVYSISVLARTGASEAQVRRYVQTALETLR